MADKARGEHFCIVSNLMEKQLGGQSFVWLVTGVAGFIGSHLLEYLLKREQKVIGLDNFSTGHRRNIEFVLKAVTKSQRARFTMVDGDIRDYDTCCKVCRGANFVLHQAALGSVPRSIENPFATHENNVTGFLNLIAAARESL